MFRPPTPLVKNLLILNIGIWLVESFMKVDLANLFGLYFIFDGQFKPFQFVTYMFLHDTGGIMHLLGNMIGLFFFGPLLENFLGQKKFLILYMVTGVGAGLFYTGVNFLEVNSVKQDVEAYLANPNPDDFNRLVVKHVDRPTPEFLDFIDDYARNENSVQKIQESMYYARMIYSPRGNYRLVGASGAIFGILAAFALFFPNTEIYMLFIPFPIKAKYLVGAYILYELYAEFQRSPNDSVAHLAHLGGALIAWILVTKWKKDRGSFY